MDLAISDSESTLSHITISRTARSCKLHMSFFLDLREEQRLVESMSDFLIVPSPEKLAADKGAKVRFLFASMASRGVVMCSASSSNIMFRSRETGKIYGMGSNKFKQLTESQRLNYSEDVECTWANDVSVESFACGVDFTIYATADQKVGIKGLETRNIGEYVRPRGLSALNNVYSFAHGIGHVVVGQVGKPEQDVEVKESIVMTAICGNSVCCLAQSGSVYVIRGSDVSAVEIDEKIRKVSGSCDKFVLLGEKTVYYGESVSFMSILTPCGSDVIDAVFQSGTIVALDRSGTLYFGNAGEKQLSAQGPKPAPVKLNSSCVFIQANDEGLFFAFGGETRPNLLIPDVSLTPGEQYNGDTFVYSLGSQFFFSKSTMDAKEAVRLVNETTRMVTVTGRVIHIEENPEMLLQWNLVKGDVIRVRTGGRLRSYTIVGVADSSIWAKEETSDYVQAVFAESVEELGEKIEDLSRVDHQVERVSVNGIMCWIDKTPSLCASLGYEPDDLIWHESKGIVEFYGVYAGQMVLLDLAKRRLFLQEQMSCKVLRRASTRLPHTRTVVCIDGTIVELDIAAPGKKLFLPTDRVESQFGQATVLGFANGNVYIQTDEMCMHGYEAVDVKADSLTLVRRIHGRADRIFTVDGEEKTVSLDTEDFVNDIFPGDKLIAADQYSSAIGFVDGKVVIQIAGASTCTYLPPQYEIYYRSDIAAVRNSPDCQPVKVGSPLFQESLLRPGDIVECPELGTAEFRGCSRNQTVFVSKYTGVSYCLSYSLLMCPNLFKIIERPAIPGFSSE